MPPRVPVSSRVLMTNLEPLIAHMLPSTFTVVLPLVSVLDCAMFGQGIGTGLLGVGVLQTSGSATLVQMPPLWTRPTPGWPTRPRRRPAVGGRPEAKCSCVRVTDEGILLAPRANIRHRVEPVPRTSRQSASRSSQAKQVVRARGRGADGVSLVHRRMLQGLQEDEAVQCNVTKTECEGNPRKTAPLIELDNSSQCDVR